MLTKSYQLVTLQFTIKCHHRTLVQLNMHTIMFIQIYIFNGNRHVLDESVLFQWPTVAYEY